MEFEGPNDEIDDEAFSESLDEALQQIVDERFEHELETIWQEQLEIVSTDLTTEPQLEPQDPVVREPDNNEKDESASRLKKGFNLFQVPQKSDEKRNEKTKKAKLREEKDEKNKQLASQKAARADAKRKKSDEKKRKRKPKDSAFLDNLEFSEELQEAEHKNHIGGDGRVLRPRRTVSKFIASLEMMIDEDTK